MVPKVIIGVYERSDDARQIVEELRNAGVAQQSISIITGETASGGPLGPFTSGAGLVQRLADMDISRKDAEAYAEAQRRGYGLVVVDARDADPDRLCGILEQQETLDLDQRAEEWRKQGWQGFESSARTFSPDEVAKEMAQFGMAAAKATARSAEQITQSAGEASGRMEQAMSGKDEQQQNKRDETRQGQDESNQRVERQQPSGGQAREQDTQKLQEVEEKVRIGKEEVRSGGVRVHTTVEERPVEEKLQLREERVTVERRDAERELSPEQADQAFQERTLEVDETREQPMVSKEARVVGEVEIGKEVEQREQTVREKERRTRIDVEKKEPAESH